MRRRQVQLIWRREHEHCGGGDHRDSRTRQDSAGRRLTVFQKTEEDQVQRKRLLAAGALVASASLVLAACGSR